MSNKSIQSLMPNSDGHQFVIYGDSCSGVPNALHEKTHAKINAVVNRLLPKPDFIIFPGDEVIGLTADEAELRQQWQYWLEHEMAWLDTDKIPIYNCTGNHTTYSQMSERVFADKLKHLPRNGAPNQDSLSYFIRRGDLLLVFVHTLSSHLGGEGHVETQWLEQTLIDNADAKYKFVIGHHPVFPINGFEGNYQRTIGAEYTQRFWKILKQQAVIAYICSHILAFDTQIHDGILQICTAGAGTAHRMPEEVEYLHAIQMAIDENGLQYQVLDDQGKLRERLNWPINLPPSAQWQNLNQGEQPAPISGQYAADKLNPAIISLRISGKTTKTSSGQMQSLFSAFTDATQTAPLWVGLTGKDQQLTIMLQIQAGRSPHYWFGPKLGLDAEFDIQLLLHSGLAAGGLMFRTADNMPWTSLTSRSATGLEKLDWPKIWSLGNNSSQDLPFLGADLQISANVKEADK